MLAVAHEYLDPIVAEGVDTLVLGCTHYPLLTGVISYVVGDEVTLVSSAEETAKRRLPRPHRQRVAQHHRIDAATSIPATGDPAAFTVLGRRFLGPEVTEVGHAEAVLA